MEGALQVSNGKRWRDGRKAGNRKQRPKQRLWESDLIDTWDMNKQRDISVREAVKLAISEADNEEDLEILAKAI